VNSERLFVRVRHPEWWIDKILGRILDPQDAVVVTGFWRSGTMWLLQSLARALKAKSVFEPFHYGLDAYRDALRSDFDLPSTEGEYLNIYMPYCGNDLSERPSLQEYTRRSLTGSVTEPWVQGPRRENRMQEGRGSEWTVLDVPYRLREALKTRVTTKFVRGHLLLPTLHEMYDPVVVHLRRDPRAVIASFQRLGWEWYEDLSLEAQLLAPKDGRSEYFGEWQKVIRRYEHADPLLRVAAYWALMERFVADLPEHPNRVTVRYEDLCLFPDETLDKMGPLSGRGRVEHFGGTSRTTEEQRTDATKRERILGWQNTLPDRIAKEIERVCERLGLEEMLFREEDLPGRSKKEMHL